MIWAVLVLTGLAAIAAGLVALIRLAARRWAAPYINTEHLNRKETPDDTR